MERQTKQKTIIYDALKTLDHPTATEVYEYVHGIYPKVSRATVFRVLGGFAEHGKALELKMAGSDVRYDYFTARHYHVHCTRCGRVADVVTKRDTASLGVVDTGGFELEGYSVEFYGTCPHCRTEKEA